MIKTPCEVALWSFLPAVRSELVKNMLDLGVARKDVAEVFEITEPAISQYLKSKRGASMSFGPLLKKEIKKSAMKIRKSKKKEDVIFELCRLCSFMRKQRLLCLLHKKENPSLKECTLYKCLCMSGKK